MPVSPASVSDWQRRRAELLGELGDLVFRWFPQERAPFSTRVERRSPGGLSEFAECTELVLDTECDVPVAIRWFRPMKDPDSAAMLLVVRSAHDQALFPDFGPVLPLLQQTHVLVVSPRYSEVLLSAGEYAIIERTAALCGRTIAAMQIWDVVRVCRWALDQAGISPQFVSAYARGSMGIVALYAALIEERIGHVVLEDPPASHREGPALLTVLRCTDIPEVAGALAPRALTFLSDPLPAFDLTREIYAAYGAQASFGCALSLTEALVRAVASGTGGTPRPSC